MTKYRTTALDEYAAWVEIAMLCESCPRVWWSEIVFIEVSPESSRVDGLCELTCAYPVALTDRMVETMKLHGKPEWKDSWTSVHEEHSGQYWFPHTDEGWNLRAKTAWKLAELALQKNG